MLNGITSTHTESENGDQTYTGGCVVFYALSAHGQRSSCGYTTFGLF